LARIIQIDKPHTRVTYDLAPVRGANLDDLVREAAK